MVKIDSVHSCQSHVLCTNDPKTGAGVVSPWRGMLFKHKLLLQQLCYSKY